jgi:hypothetical protein
MTPKQSHERNAGGVEALPDALRDMLLQGGGHGARGTGPGKEVPGLPKKKKHKTGTETRSWARGMLSKRQMAEICMTAERAYLLQLKYGLVDEGTSKDDWRRAEQLKTVSIESLKDCRQAHYRPLLGHFQALEGQREVKTFNHTQAQPDDPDRRSMTRALLDEIERFAELTANDGTRTGWHRAHGYLLAIAEKRGRVVPRHVDTITATWDPKKIEELVTTMRNRISAKRGVGETENRNKSQRKKQ